MSHPTNIVKVRLQCLAPFAVRYSLSHLEEPLKIHLHPNVPTNLGVGGFGFSSIERLALTPDHRLMAISIVDLLEFIERLIDELDVKL